MQVVIFMAVTHGSLIAGFRHMFTGSPDSDCAPPPSLSQASLKNEQLVAQERS